MKKIVITGPESSGKTTLAQQLAQHFGTTWSPEYARQYLEGLGRPYSQGDLLEIAKGQIALEEKCAAEATSGLLFLDTSLEVLKIWSEFKYGHCHPWILEQWQTRRADFYLLCQPDLPWEFDPLRENPDDRPLLFEIYLRELTLLGADFAVVEGSGEGRLKRAIATLFDLRIKIT